MSDLSAQVLSVAALYDAITAVAAHRKITMREVAAETGLSTATFTRISQGHKPDADGLVTLLGWLGHEVRFARPRLPQQEGS